MGQAEFKHDLIGSGGIPSTVGIHSTRSSAKADLWAYVSATGCEPVEYNLLSELDDTPPVHPMDVLVIDCPVQNGATMAALVALDLRVRRTMTRVIVLTTITCLDAVFSCLEDSNPSILVEPCKEECVVALSIALTKTNTAKVRDLSSEDREHIDRIAEQVSQILTQLDRLGVGDSAFRLGSPGDDFRGDGESERQLIRPPRPPLPDPRLVRRIIRQRQLRAQFIGGELFADPAWDILLDLTAARAEHARVSVTSLCIASGVPPTTALRWIAQMTEAGLLQRVEDESDRRRAFIELSDRAAEAMARYFHELGKDAKSLV